MLENDIKKSYITISHDNNTVDKNYYACIGKVKKIRSSLVKNSVLNMEMRITNIHTGYMNAESLNINQSTTLSISQVTNKGVVDKTIISNTNITDFDIRVYEDSDYIYIYVKGNYEYYDGYLKIDLLYENGLISWYPNAFAKFEPLPTTLSEVDVLLQEGCPLYTRKLSSNYKYYSKILRVATHKRYSFVVTIYGNPNNESAYEKYKISCNNGIPDITLLESDLHGTMDGENTRTNFVYNEHNKTIDIFIRSFGSGARAYYKISEISNVTTNSILTYMYEYCEGSKDKGSLSAGMGDIKSDSNTVSDDNTGCYYTIDRLRNLGTLLPINKSFLAVSSMYQLTSENVDSISTQGVGIGIIDSYLYYQFCYDWIRVQFRTNSTITQKRVYYGNQGWGSWS